MSPAVTGPIPSIVSSCSTLALPRLIGPSSAAAPAGGRNAATGADLRNHHLLAVAEPRRQVDRFQRRPAAGATRPLDGVGDPSPDRQPVDARPAHGAGDVDDHIRPAGAELKAVAGGRAAGSAALVSGREVPARGSLRRPRAGLAADRPGPDQQQGDGERPVDEDLRSAQLGEHEPMLGPRGARGGALTQTIRLSLLA